MPSAYRNVLTGLALATSAFVSAPQSVRAQVDLCARRRLPSRFRGLSLGPIGLARTAFDVRREAQLSFWRPSNSGQETALVGKVEFVDVVSGEVIACDQVTLAPGESGLIINLSVGSEARARAIGATVTMRSMSGTAVSGSATLQVFDESGNSQGIFRGTYRNGQ